jgi:hypothetical protein
MAMLRAGHAATLLEDGTVLVTGGSGNRTAEIYDPATNRFRTIAASMAEVRSLHGAVRFANGQVFLTDGGARTGEAYDPVLEVFTATSNKSNVTRSAAVTFQFRPGEVLIVGGIDFSVSFIHASMEQFVLDYGPGGRYFHITPLPDHGVYLKDPRAFSAASRLADGRFLITGGLGPSYDLPDLDTAVIFDPSIK